MKTQVLLTMLVTARMLVSAADRVEASPVVYVHTRGLPTYEGFVQNYTMATGIASRMFANAEVRVKWRFGLPKGFPNKTPADVPPIVVDFTTGTPKTAYAADLAIAHVFEGVHITVFYDRVANMVAREQVPTLLAHVLVHEITHLLQGFDGHSESGVMKARWSTSDMLEMAWKPLGFPPSDVYLIHRGLRERTARLERRTARNAE